MAALRLPPLSVTQSPVSISRGHALVKSLGAPMLATQDASHAGRARAGAGSSPCLRIRGTLVRSVSGSAMREEEVEDEEVGEGEVSGSGNGLVEGVAEEDRAPLVVVSFYKFANLPDYEQKRAPLKELCEANVWISANC